MEIVYGLGVNVMDDEVIVKIFEVKGRLSDNLFIVYIGIKFQLDGIVKEILLVVEKLMVYFWLGLLIIILLRKEGILEKVMVGFNMVGVRMFDYLIVFVFIEEVNVFVVVLSVNCLGCLSLILVFYVYEDLNGKIVGIVDGGVIGVGVELIVIDCISMVLIILCLGGIMKE